MLLEPSAFARTTVITFREIEPHQADAAIDVICRCFHEFWGEEGSAPADVRRRVEADGVLDDVRNVREHYFDQGGTFRVILADGRVVGTGAVAPLQRTVCELRRMWILQGFRRRGLGTEMARRLMGFARSRGFERVRLHTSSDLQGAIRFYERLGFEHIEPYKQTKHSDVFMQAPLGADTPQKR